jgi:hypothetical protein
MAWFSGVLMRLCRNRPPVTREVAGLNRLILLGYTLLQLAVVLMFLIWNLIYLSLASGVVLALFVIVEIRGMIRVGRLHSNEGEDKT